MVGSGDMKPGSELVVLAIESSTLHRALCKAVQCKSLPGMDQFGVSDRAPEAA